MLTFKFSKAKISYSVRQQSNILLTKSLRCYGPSKDSMKNGMFTHTDKLYSFKQYATTHIVTWIEILTRLGCLLKVKRIYLDIHVTWTPLLRFQNTILLKSSHYAMIEAILRYRSQLFYYKHKYIVNGNWK